VELSENKRQRRTSRDIKKGILFSKGKIRSDKEKGENQIVGRILQSNNRSQPLECGLETGKREEENQHSHKNTSKTISSLTTDTKETLRLMLEYFTPEDNDLNNNNHHKRIRELTKCLTQQTTANSQEKGSEG